MIRRICGLAAAIALSGAATVAAPAQADPIIIPDPTETIGFIDGIGLSCTELVPHTLTLDDLEETLDVRVLLDGVDRDTAREAVADARRAYAPLGLSIDPTYENVSFGTTDAVELNQAAKDRFGGERPAGTDVVYTMTSKDITSTGPTGGNVAGQADCIGGIENPDTAFAVGEVIEDGPGSLLGIPLPTQLNDATGKTMAHEIGHLLGAHHHYFSPEGLLAADPNVGSLMGPTLSIVSLRFSTLNASVVKGHVQAFGVG